MSNALSWKIDRASGQVQLIGRIDEDAKFGELQAAIKGIKTVRIDLSGISRINSFGVREWIRFVKSVIGASDIRLEQCSPFVIAQMNMITNFAGGATIVSAQTPYACIGCGSEARQLVHVTMGSQPSVPDTIACPKCGSVMEFDDLRDTYFSFLKPHTK